MQQLKERILRDGKCFEGGILKVDNFINHQMDPILMKSMAVEFVRRFASRDINKILTIEASGIAPAIMVGYLLELPVVFAKKSKSSNIGSELYAAGVDSFTHGNRNTVVVSAEYLKAGDRILIIDDFLATGSALMGLLSLCDQAGAQVQGCGILIEKLYQGGGELVRRRCRVESLAQIARMDEQGIVFAR